MSTSTDSLVERLAAAGGGSTRPAAATDAVAGVPARVVVEPTSEEQVAACLAFADREHLKVVPRGGGTQLTLGFPPGAADIVLSTAGLHKLVDYNPHDLTVTVESGMPLTALQHVLAPSGQILALDPPLADAATIGGIIATNSTGALRLRYGGVRDQIIGVRVVTADGTVAKGGGKVVKNVAGYDLPKLFTGSLGTLGVIVAATFRVYPLPAATRTVLVTAPDLARLGAVAQGVLGSTLEPASLCVAGATDDAGATSLAVRFHSVAEAVSDQAERLVTLARDLGAQPRTLSERDEADFWRAVARDSAPEPAHSEAMLLKASILPTHVVEWLQELARVAAACDIEARFAAHAGHGIIFARLSGRPEGLMAALAPLRDAAGPVPERGSVVVCSAPANIVERVDVWGPSPALALMRRLKHAFDPNATLNPGRFIGRI